jgi:hypothetical protein
MFKFFNSLSEYSNYLESAPTSKMFKTKLTPSANQEGITSWAGTENFQEAQELLINGDDKSFTQLSGGAGFALPAAPTPRRRVKNSVVGTSVDVGKYLSGVPACMRRTTRELAPSKRRVIDIYYSPTISASISAETAVKTNNIFLNAIKILESKGARVNLFVWYCAARNDELSGAAIKVKSSTEPLNVYRLSYPLINPSAIRRHFLRYIECDNTLRHSKWWKGYGRPVKYAGELLKQLQAVGRDTQGVKSFTFYDIRSKSLDDILNAIIA